MNYQVVLDNTIKELDGKRPKLLLHVCCGPCSSYVMEYLNKYFDITIYYYNPNIDTKEEFDKRTGYFSRTQVGARIDSCLRDRTNTTASDGPIRDVFNQELGHIISHEKFANWLLGRYNIDLIVFQKIASELTTSIQYLLTDLHAKVPEDFDPVLFNEARENANSVHCLYNLSEDKKQIVSDMLNKLMELEHLEHVSKK